MTQKQDNGQQNEHFGITSTVSNVTTYENESNIVNLFTIGASKDTGKVEMQEMMICQGSGPAYLR